MRWVLLPLIVSGFSAMAQKAPCESDTLYRQFDFWIGDWEAFGPGNKKAGDSKISVILDGCIILEEWTSASLTQGLRYAGKSYNTWNRTTRQWQQTWVDNVGGSTEYLKGGWNGVKMEFCTSPFYFTKDTLAIRRLSFYPNTDGTVRQHGEISKDDGKSWSTEYDLLYRRKKKE